MTKMKDIKNKSDKDLSEFVNEKREAVRQSQRLALELTGDAVSFEKSLDLAGLDSSVDLRHAIRGFFHLAIIISE